MPATQTPFRSSEEGVPISRQKRLGDSLVSGLEKIGGSLNSFSNRIGSEAWWPTTLDHECEKAARILSSFCSMFTLPAQEEVANFSQRMNAILSGL
jgi:hypothetical protein